MISSHIHAMEEMEKIIEFSKKDPNFLFYRRYLKNDDGLCRFVQSELLREPWFETERLYMICVSRGIMSPVKCDCGSNVEVRKALKGKRFCSCSCSNRNEGKKEKERATNCLRYGCDYSTQSDEINRKRRDTMMERYGVERPMQSAEIRENAKKTVLERYGTDYVAKNEEIKERIRRTNIERYGCECTLQNASVKRKAVESIRRRYGVDSPTQSNEIKERIRNGNIEKYGVPCVSQLESVKEKTRQTNLIRYGYDNVLSSEIVRQKVRETNLRKYGAENYMHSDEYRRKSFALLEKFKGDVVPLFGWESWHGWNTGIAYKWKCVKCGNEFETGIHCFELDGVRMPRCLSCHPFLGNGNGSSVYENELLDFICSVYSGKVVHGDRTVLFPLELDIYLPEKKIAIEFDGLYWHSEKRGKDESYHLGKTEACERNGIRLLHIFEDEWKSHRQIVEDRIRSILGVGQSRVFARKCELKEVPAKESNAFLEKNHLQGGDNSSVRYGLYCDGELVSVMTFGKPRFSKSYDWELIRFASKCGLRVIGGASKLLSHFRRSHSGSIVSYADRRYSDGRLYEALGFRKAGVSKPNYWYVNGESRLSRYACQKHRLPALLGDGFDERLSETDNMLANGYDKVHDCGNLVYVLE